MSSNSSDSKREPHTFWYMSHRYLFDVDRAIELVDDGREMFELDERSARLAVKESTLNRSRLGFVDPEIPGIVAHIRYRDESGELLCGQVLIDGHHRACRCLEEGRPVLVRILDEKESLEVLLRCPPESMPAAEEVDEIEKACAGSQVSVPSGVRT